MTLAERLAAFAHDLTSDRLPPDVVAPVRRRGLDVLGLALGLDELEDAGALARLGRA